MKLDRYSDFILEKNIMLLNESVIQYSEKFQELLGLIDSPIAKKLLELYKEDMDVKSNWFDIGKDADSLSFLVDAKAQRMETENKRVRVTIPSPLISYYYSETLNELGFVRSKLHIPELNEIGEIKAETTRMGERILLLYFDEPGDKQCVIKANFTKPDDSIFWNKNRQEIRVGRGIRALLTALKIDFNDAQIEDFVNKYKAAFEIVKDAFRNFEVVKGNKIAELYHYDNYLEPDTGDLGNSCMKRKPSWYFGIYTQNSSVCSLLVLKSSIDPTKIVGRALVWNLSEPDIIFMDRVYTNKPSQVELFREYAKSKGWYYKKKNDNSSSPETISPQGETKVWDELRVRIKALAYTGYPYVDTLKYLHEGNKLIYLSTDSDGHDKLLEDTDGNWVSDVCECCGGSGREGCQECDSTGQVECIDCEKSGVVECDDCDGTGELSCQICNETGKVGEDVCSNCEGNGTYQCSNCDGSGDKECESCNGDGKSECGDCEGDGQVRCGCCN